MKVMKIITVFCWLIVAAVLLGLAGWFLTGTVFGARSERWSIMPFSFNIGGFEALAGPYEIAGSYTIDANGLDSINVDWIAGGITIKPHDGDNILITEYAQRELRDDEKLVTGSAGGTLTIMYRKNTTVNIINMPTKKLDVLVPRGLSENMSRLAVESVSGSIDAEYFQAENIKLNTISGGITLSNSVANELKLDTTSGRVTVTYVQAEDIEVDSISGSIHVSDSSARAIDCDTTSGSVRVSGGFGKAKLNSISGRIELDNTEQRSTVDADSTSGSVELTGAFDIVAANTLSGSITVRSRSVPASLKADSASGSINIAIPNEGTVSVYHSSTSGRFSSEVPVVMQGRGAQFELTTLSGRAKITILEP